MFFDAFYAKSQCICVEMDCPDDLVWDVDIGECWFPCWLEETGRCAEEVKCPGDDWSRSRVGNLMRDEVTKLLGISFPSFVF